MKNRPLVSVIIPAYNHEQYIEEALRSVISQSYNNIELIVINDGSTDGTAGIIEEFVRNNSDKNIQFVNKLNEGVCKTLNKGLTMSTGDYVAFLASDDFWSKDRIETQLEFMENNVNIGLVFSDAWLISFNTRSDFKWSDYKPGIIDYFKNGIQNTDMYTLLLTQPIVPALTVLIRKQVLLDVGYFDEKLVYEDFDMWLRIADKYPVGYINKPLAFYRIHGTNISNDTKHMIRGMFQTLRKHLRGAAFKGKTMFKIKIIGLLACSLISSRLKKKSRKTAGV